MNKQESAGVNSSFHTVLILTELRHEKYLSSSNKKHKS